MNGLSVDMLRRLSYKSGLGRSLTNTIHRFDRDELLSELFFVSEWLQEEIGKNDVTDYRIKSRSSIIRKYERYYPNRPVISTFNDILGFRAVCDRYDGIGIAGDELFRTVDMSGGKTNDDGYRGVHIYFHIDNYHYPIEIQFNTVFDRQFNDWLHMDLYKKGFSDDIGQQLRNSYEKGLIRDYNDFKKELQNVLSYRKGL